MRLIMYVDGTEIDAISIPRTRISLTDLIEDLKKKHKDLLNDRKTIAEFVLDGVPSQVSSFQSLLKR